MGRLITDFNFGRASGSWQTKAARPTNLVPSGLLPPLVHSNTGLSKQLPQSGGRHALPTPLCQTAVKVSPFPKIPLSTRPNVIERTLLISLWFWKQMHSFEAFQNQERGTEGGKIRQSPTPGWNMGRSGWKICLSPAGQACPWLQYGHWWPNLPKVVWTVHTVQTFSVNHVQWVQGLAYKHLELCGHIAFILHLAQVFVSILLSDIVLWTLWNTNTAAKCTEV